MAKKKTLTTPYSDIPAIDDLIDGVAALTLTSPITGSLLKFEILTFKGKDILNKVSVHKKNQRIQKYLNENSLSHLIKSFQKTGQITPALGRLNADGTIEAIYGSRRRLAAYYSGQSYTILVNKNITDEEAEILSDAENISEDISLIERGELWWEIEKDESLSSREIALEFETGVSHTIIAAGIAGAKLPDNVKALYPAVNKIGRPTILKLAKACKEKSGNEISNYINEEHSSMLLELSDAYSNGCSTTLKTMTSHLTNLIVSFACESTSNKGDKKAVAIKTNTKWFKGIKAQINKGKLCHIVFEDDLSVEQIDNLKNFLKNL
jgi:ParB/RepB/Spo0J family partition protein